MTVRYLTVEDLLTIRSDFALGEVLDLGLLESAVARPRASVFGVHAYSTLPIKAAALMVSVTNNHGLVDGNKRLGVVAVLLSLALNDHRSALDEDGMFDLSVAIAAGREDSLERVAEGLEVVPRARA